jgi:hypothetical protein
MLRPVGYPGWCTNLIEASVLRPGEHALVVVDEPLAEQGSELVAAVKDAGALPEIELWAGDRPFKELPSRIRRAAKRAEVLFSLQQAPRGDEAAIRHALNETVLERGGRGLFLGLVDPELLAGELSRPAPKLADLADRLLGEVRDADKIRLRNPAGTDLTLRVSGRSWMTDAKPLGPGDYGNFPGGEIFCSPLEDSADGVLVADLTVPYTVEGLVDAPVTLRFQQGRVTSIEGGRAAEMLRALVESADEGGKVIGEFGIGLNPAIKPRGHVMLDEKAAGTAHVAIGNNTGSYGGANSSTIHVDCVLSAPTVEVDGRRLELT